MAAQLSLGETASGKGAAGPGGRPVALPVRELSSSVGLIAGAGGHDTAAVLVDALADGGHTVIVLDRDGGLTDLVGGPDVVTCHGASDADVPLGTEPTDDVVSQLHGRDAPVVVDGRRTDDGDLSSLVHALLEKRTPNGSRAVVVSGLAVSLPHEEPVDEFGRAIRRLVTRGPDRGLGLIGVVAEPAALSERVREACDWSIWHRLNRTADTSVVRRELGGERAQAVRELADDEAFLTTEWTGSVDRISVDRGRKARFANRTPRRVEADAEGPIDESVRGGGDLARLVDRLESVAKTLEDELDSDRVAAEVADALEPRLENPEAGAGGLERTDGSPDADETAADDGFAGLDLLDDAGAGDDGGPAPGRGSGTGDGLAALAGAGDQAADSNATPENGDRGAVSPLDGETGEADRIVGDGGLDVDSFSAELAAFEEGVAAVEAAGASAGDKPAVVVDVESTLADLDDAAVAMLDYYRAEGPARPEAAHSAATGLAARVPAYRLNRQLRRAGFVQHLGRGHYEYSLRERLAAGLPADRDEEMTLVYARDLEQSYLD